MQQEKEENPKEALSVLGVTQNVIEKSQLWNHESLAFHAHLQPGFERLVFMAGPNATGKSLLSKIVQAFGKKHFNTSPINVSMVERTGSGTSEMAGMRRMFMFGDESEQSTGATSADTARKGLENAKSYANEGKRALLVLDEPEIGLSEGYEYALGLLIGQKTLELPASACGVLVISHSKALAEGLKEGLGAPPSFLFTGEKPLSLEDWMTTKERLSIEDLSSLERRGLETWQAVEKVLDSSKK